MIVVSAVDDDEDITDNPNDVEIVLVVVTIMKFDAEPEFVNIKEAVDVIIKVDAAKDNVENANDVENELVVVIIMKFDAEAVDVNTIEDVDIIITVDASEDNVENSNDVEIEVVVVTIMSFDAVPVDVNIIEAVDVIKTVDTTEDFVVKTTLIITVDAGVVVARNTNAIGIIAEEDIKMDRDAVVVEIEEAVETTPVVVMLETADIEGVVDTIEAVRIIVVVVL